MNVNKLLFLLLLTGIAAALPANYTSVLVYDEQTGLLINDTNITIANTTASHTFNRTQMNYLLASNSTEVNGITGGSGDAELEMKKNTTVAGYVDYYQVDSKYTLGDCNVVGASGIAVTFYYADGTSAGTGQAVTGSYVTYTFQNQNLNKFVNNIAVFMQENCASNYYSIKNDAAYAYNTLSMLNITARGASTITAASAGYQNSKYYVTLTENTTLNQTAYLLATASALNKQFTIQDTLGTVLPNVKLTLSRFINNTWQIVREETSDSSGIIVIQVESGVLYAASFTAAGYATLTQTYLGNTAQVLVTLSTETGLNLDHQTEGIYWSMQPSVNSLHATENQTISFTAVSNNASLTDYSLLLYWLNGTVIFNQTVISSSGGILSHTMNLTGITSGRSIKAAGSFTKAGYPVFWVNRTFYIYNATTSNRTLFGLMPTFPANNGLGEMATTLIALTVVLLVTGGLAASVGGVGAGLVGLVVLGMFAFVGWFSAGIYLAVLVVVAGLYYLRSG